MTRPRSMTGASSRLLIGTLSVVAGIAVWDVLAKTTGQPLLFPAPLGVWDELLRRLESGRLLTDTVWSLGRLIVAFLAGSAVGAIVGVLAGSLPSVRMAVSPLITFFRFIPPIAWLAPALLWFGAGEGSKFFILVYSCFFVVAVNVIDGVSSTHPQKRRSADVFGLRPWEKILLVMAPSALPAMFTGMRVALGNAFMSIVLAEMLGAREGLGTLITSGMTTANTAQTFIGIFMIGALGLLADWALRRGAARLRDRYDVHL